MTVQLKQVTSLYLFYRKGIRNLSNADKVLFYDYMLDLFGGVSKSTDIDILVGIMVDYKFNNTITPTSENLVNVMKETFTGFDQKSYVASQIPTIVEVLRQYTEQEKVRMVDAFIQLYSDFTEIITSLDATFFNNTFLPYLIQLTQNVIDLINMSQITLQTTTQVEVTTEEIAPQDVLANAIDNALGLQTPEIVPEIQTVSLTPGESLTITPGETVTITAEETTTVAVEDRGIPEVIDLTKLFDKNAFINVLETIYPASVTKTLTAEAIYINVFDDFYTEYTLANTESDIAAESISTSVIPTHDISPAFIESMSKHFVDGSYIEADSNQTVPTPVTLAEGSRVAESTTALSQNNNTYEEGHIRVLNPDPYPPKGGYDSVYDKRSGTFRTEK